MTHDTDECWIKGEKLNVLVKRRVPYMKLEMCHDIIRRMPTSGSTSPLLPVSGSSLLLLVLIFASSGESCLPNFDLDFSVSNRDNNQTNVASEVPRIPDKINLKAENSFGNVY